MTFKNNYAHYNNFKKYGPLNPGVQPSTNKTLNIWGLIIYGGWDLRILLIYYSL